MVFFPIFGEWSKHSGIINFCCCITINILWSHSLEMQILKQNQKQLRYHSYTDGEMKSWIKKLFLILRKRWSFIYNKNWPRPFFRRCSAPSLSETDLLFLEKTPECFQCILTNPIYYFLFENILTKDGVI